MTAEQTHLATAEARATCLDLGHLACSGCSLFSAELLPHRCEPLPCRGHPCVGCELHGCGWGLTCEAQHRAERPTTAYATYTRNRPTCTMAKLGGLMHLRTLRLCAWRNLPALDLGNLRHIFMDLGHTAAPVHLWPAQTAPEILGVGYPRTTAARDQD